MKKQIVIIQGADTFATYKEYLQFLRDFNIDIERYKTGKGSWKPWLREMLQDDFETIIPQMPNPTNARYEEWKIWMDKLVPFLTDDVILIGHSMGGVFLAKYLSENKFPKKIKAVFLVAPVYDKDADGNTALSFSLPEKLDLQTENIYLYHSKDDPVVPFSALGQYQKALPSAFSKIFEDKKHINQEEFPELLEDIKNLT